VALYKRGNSWWMNFWFDGRHIQKSTKCKNKRDAEVVERAYQTQLAKGEVGIEPKRKAPTFQQAIKDYLVFLEVEHASKRNTFRRYENDAKVLLRYFGDTPVDKITTEMVDKFKLWRSNQKGEKTKRKLEPATINHEIYFLKMLCKRLLDLEVLSKNPSSKLKCLEVENEHTRTLSKEERQLYLLACTQPLQDVAILMLETGMRPSEVLNLLRNDVDIEKGVLFVREGKTKSARRKIPLSQQALRVLAKRTSIEVDCLFPNQNITKLNYAHLKAVSRAGILAFRLYDLRHTFATLHVENDTDVVTLASLLGHKDLKMIMRYAHPSEQHKQEAIQRLENRQERIA
jgi:integrase